MKLAILLLVFTFASVAGVVAAPAMPDLEMSFSISASKAQWTMSIFLIGYTLGQLPYGPLANRFGRKKALNIGIILTLAGSLIAFFSTHFSLFCIGRFVQAIGAGAGLKIGFTMVADQHSGTAAARILALLTLGFAIVAGLATTIGGYFTDVWGWQGPIGFTIFYSLLILGLACFLPETAPMLHPDALKWKKITHNFAKQVKDPFLTLHAFLTGLATTIVYIFVTLSPYIAIQGLGLSPSAFGLWALIPSLGLMSGVLTTRFISHKSNPRLNMLSGILLVMVGTVVQALFFAAGMINVWTLFLPIYFVYIGTNLVWTHASSKGISESEDRSNASAVLQCINMGCATVGVFLVEVAEPTARMLLPAAFGVVIILMLGTWMRLKAHHR